METYFNYLEAETQHFFLKDYLKWFSKMSRLSLDKAQTHPNFWSNEVFHIFLLYQQNKKNNGLNKKS